MSIQNVDCSGCSACYVACPFSAITMGFDDRGTYCASVDATKCTECGICNKVCSSTVVNIPSISKDKVLTAVAKDRTVLERSSSGGIGYILAKKAVEQGMIACGVTYDSSLECAKHVLVSSIDELYSIQGSKYLQSVNADSFMDMVNDSRKYIVFGTPCQIAGLAKVLELKDRRDRFILIDIFCHGTPSQLLWQNHLSYLKKKGKISEFDSVIFRQAKNYRICIGNYRAWYNQDAFYTFFLRGWMKNHKCYFCNYRRNSFADIRIGDCMVKKYDQLFFSPSTIILNTSIGEEFFNTCVGEIEAYTEPFATVDGIQERDNMPVPLTYEKMLSELQSGKYPEDIIKSTMLKGRTKALIKQIIRSLKSDSTSDDLESIIGRHL